MNESIFEMTFVLSIEICQLLDEDNNVYQWRGQPTHGDDCIIISLTQKYLVIYLLKFFSNSSSIKLIIFSSRCRSNQQLVDTMNMQLKYF